ncbi:PadR family transcriptional regulator [Nonomuraea sp. FMUSA5-5]|uniref:PadR family transcriptional regulator n=1 Tax=Nonomuraea composti TaxID=2720023 RepID=A0ABX1B3V0_9ACTN|nr:PadR family transcriptional regulator [Nonomuraea sp. FMUSA5-5]
MSDARLFVLGALLAGPMHGHQIRRQAQLDRTELWTDIKVGSLYGALHRLVAEGAIEVVRTEQGAGPARTVYALTPAGHEEFIALRDRTLREVRLRPDPVDLALHYADDLTEQDLRALIGARRDALVARLTAWLHQREQAEPYLRGLEPMTFDHTTARLRAEIAWHESLLERLPGLLAANGRARPPATEGVHGGAPRTEAAHDRGQAPRTEAAHDRGQAPRTEAAHDRSQALTTETFHDRDQAPTTEAPNDPDPAPTAEGRQG